MKMIIDCLGGDHSPRANVRGAVAALKQYDDLELILAGPEQSLKDELAAAGWTGGRVEILDAPDEITGNDKPTDAIRLKKDSSMIKGIRLLREDPTVSAIVSTGSTGALVAAATMRIGRIRGIRRPAFCPILPTMAGGIVGVCDSGANPEIFPEQLVEFAVMGSLYLKSAFGVENPRVALLNVGVEEEKGDELHKKAHALLKQTPLVNFVGNMESRDLLTGNYDLVVCDGFSGNVLIKSAEGTASELLKMIKRDIMSKTRYKLGAALMKDMFKKEKEFMNYQNYGGSVLLGTEKIIVKGHGSSDEKAVSVCISQAVRMEKSGLGKAIEQAMAALADKQEEKNV